MGKFDTNLKQGGGMFVKLESGGSVTGVLAGDVVIFSKTWKDGRTTERFKTNLIVNEDGQLTAKILEQGASVYNKLKDLELAGYDLEKTVLKIARTGAGMETKYAVLPVPKGDLTDDHVKLYKAVRLHPLNQEALPKQESSTPVVGSSFDQYQDDIPI